MDEDVRLTFEIKNEAPVSVADLTLSFSSMNDQYDRFIQQQKTPMTAKGTQLYIREIRAGSIITDLIVLAPLLLPFAERANTILDFAGYLKIGFLYLLGKEKEKPNFKKKDFENFSNIVEPIAKDSSSQWNINTFINGDVNLVLTLPSIEANAIQNAARREIAELKEPITGLHEKVLLYFYQARNDPKSHTGDKGYIESICSSPVKVIFKDEELKSRILCSEENPFTAMYIVDVAVETIDNRPMLYRVMHLHEVVERPQSQDI